MWLIFGNLLNPFIKCVVWNTLYRNPLRILTLKFAILLKIFLFVVNNIALEVANDIRFISITRIFISLIHFQIAFNSCISPFATPKEPSRRQQPLPSLQTTTTSMTTTHFFLVREDAPSTRRYSALLLRVAVFWFFATALRYLSSCVSPQIGLFSSAFASVDLERYVKSME